MKEVASRNGLSYERDFEALPRQPRLLGEADDEDEDEDEDGDEYGDDGGEGGGGDGGDAPSSSSSPPSTSAASSSVPASAAEAAERFEICLCDNAFCSSFTGHGRFTAAYCLLAQDPLCRPCAYVRDAREVDRAVLGRPGKVQNALLFTTAYIPMQTGGGRAEDFNVNTTVGYILMFNATVAQYPYYGENHATALKLAVDEAALALATGQPNTRLAAAQRGFPTPPNRLAGVDVASGQAGIFFYVPPMVAFFHTLTELAGPIVYSHHHHIFKSALTRLFLTVHHQ